MVRDVYVINTWSKREAKIQNTSKVIVFTRNHTDDDTDDDGTKNNTSPDGRGGDIMTVNFPNWCFMALKKVFEKES